MRLLVIRTSVLALLLSALPACGDDTTGGAGGSGGAGNDFLDDDFVLQDNARIVDADLRDDALISANDETGEYVFDSSALAAAGIDIEAGNTLLIADQFLVTVASATESAGELLVMGTPAALPDLVQDGFIQWDLGLGSETLPAPVLLIGDQVVYSKGGAGLGDSIDYSTEVDGFSITVKITPNSSARQLEVQIQIDRSAGGGTVDFRAVATGTIRLFRHALDLDIQDSTTQNWAFGARNLEFELEVEAAGANAGTVSTTLVLPGPFQLRFPIPTSLPLGLNLALSINLLAEVDLPALASASTQFDATFRYQGSAGFQQTGTAGFTTEGNNGGATVDVSDPNTAATSGPVGFTVAFSAPRIALNALADQVTARLDNIYSMAGQLRGSPIGGLCIESGAQHSLRGTVTAGFFGISLAEFSHEFYQDELFKDTGTCEDSALNFPVPQ
ncbi:MAG: hypothetical protein WBG86_11890 [Polyangiales bacterium]